MRYTISEMAALLGVTTHTLRYYEKMGLIQPEVNEDTGYRYYTVTDTRRFNLCREFRSADFTLEECRLFMDTSSLEQCDALLTQQIERLRKKKLLIELSINFLTQMQEDYQMLEEDLHTVRVRNYPEMWRLAFSQEEDALQDAQLEQEKEEWLECMPAVKWVSRIPRYVMERFGIEKNDYDYGLMIEASAAKKLGLRKTAHVEIVPGGDYLTTVWKKDYRGPFGWDSLQRLHDEIEKQGFRTFGDTFSYILASQKEADGSIVNYHFLGTKIYS